MSGPMNNDPRTSTEIERDILRAGLRERDEEIARLRAVVAGDPSPRMIRTEDETLRNTGETHNRSRA